MLCHHCHLLPGWGSNLWFASLAIRQGSPGLQQCMLGHAVCAVRPSKFTLQASRKPHLLTTAEQATAQSPRKVQPGSGSHLDTEGTSWTPSLHTPPPVLSSCSSLASLTW